jgi:hypothetical protein
MQTYKSNGGVTLPKTAGKVLPDLSQQNAAIMAELERLKAENAALKQGRGKGPGMKLAVSEKKAVMLLGLRRFPITFYKHEWLAMISIAKQIEAFIETHDHELSQGRGE